MSDTAAPRRKASSPISAGLIVLVLVLAGLGAVLVLSRIGGSAPTGNIHRDLSQALKSAYPEEGKIAGDKATEIEAYPAPFLKKHTIYKVLNNGAYGPIMFYVGYGSTGRAFMLSNHLENYAAMAKADGLSVDSPQVAEEYVTAGLEVTRSMSRLVYLLKSVDDLMWRGNLDAQEMQARQAYSGKYRQVIAAPRAQETGQGYIVTAYVASDTVLEQHAVSVGRRGDLQDQVTVLEKGMPLKVGL